MVSEVDYYICMNELVVRLLSIVVFLNKSILEGFFSIFEPSGDGY